MEQIGSIVLHIASCQHTVTSIATKQDIITRLIPFPQRIIHKSGLMADYIRRVVSGNKARFKDDILGLELGRYSSIV